jgi:hypothetical protein
LRGRSRPGFRDGIPVGNVMASPAKHTSYHDTPEDVMRYGVTAVLTASGLALLAPSATAQGAAPAGPTPEYVCGLLTKAQVEKVLGRKIFEQGEGMRLKGGAVCDFDGDEAQVMYFTAPNADANWEGLLKSFGQDKNKRTPLPGLGAPAYVIYPPTRNEYQAVVAMVVVKAGQNTLVVSSSVKKKGDPAETALAPTIELVKLVLPKLK